MDTSDNPVNRFVIRFCVQIFVADAGGYAGLSYAILWVASDEHF